MVKSCSTSLPGGDQVDGLAQDILAHAFVAFVNITQHSIMTHGQVMLSSASWLVHLLCSTIVASGAGAVVLHLEGHPHKGL